MKEFLNFKFYKDVYRILVWNDLGLIGIASSQFCLFDLEGSVKEGLEPYGGGESVKPDSWWGWN